MQTASCRSSVLPHFGYTGAFRSRTTGLYHFGARWYSSRIGQFISPDPLWYVDSFDVYGYAGFDPVNYWDPSGLSRGNLGDSGQRSEMLGAAAELLGQRGRASRSDFGVDLAPVVYPAEGLSGTPSNPPDWERPQRSGLRPSVSRDEENVSIKIRLRYGGLDTTPEQRTRWNRWIEDTWSGRFGRFNVTTTVVEPILPGGQPIFGWRWNSITVIDSNFTSGVTESRSGTIRANADRYTVAHEIGHFLGLPDRRFLAGDGLSRPRGYQVQHPWPGWAGNLMARSRSLGNPAVTNEIWEEDIIQILENFDLLDEDER